jgi:hypothetical protein
MKLLSPARKLRVLPRAPHLFALKPDRSLLSSFPTPTLHPLFLSNSLLPPYRDPPRFTPQPRHTFTLFLPTIEFT